MKKEEQLLKELKNLVKDTENGTIQWDIQYQTTEYNDPKKKPVEKENGEEWVIDECFVSYHCMYQNEEFLMITYEQLFHCGEKERSCNLIFLPPLGVRFFDVDILAPYAVKTDKMLTYEVHILWKTILDRYKKDSKSVQLEVSPRELVLFEQQNMERPE